MPHQNISINRNLKIYKQKIQKRIFIFHKIMFNISFQPTLDKTERVNQIIKSSNTID